MQVIIPMAGEGSRFPKSQYPKPKPLIEIDSKPMIYHAVKSLGVKGEYYFLVRNNEHSDEIVHVIKNSFSNYHLKFTDNLTNGPACSCLFFEDIIDKNDELIIANCDQIMWWNSEQFLSAARNFTIDGLVVTYTSTTKKNSFAEINRNGFAKRLKEKEVISNISLNGIHYWRKASYFIDSAKEMISKKDTAPNGEYYVAPTYNYLIAKGFKIGIYHIPDTQHHSVGVPEDLEKYKKLIDNKQNKL